MGTMIITGTSTGIGLAASVTFAERGHQVFATMRNLGRSADLRKAAAAAGVDVQIREMDVDNAQSIETCISSILDSTGRVDVLINNAGVALMRPWEYTAIEQIEQIFRTNFFGAVRCAMAVVPTMRSQGSGAIVNVASVAGRMAVPIQGPYCASKFALDAFSESLAIELRGHGVRVVSILPGFTNTPILTKAWEGYEADPSNPYAALWARWSALYEQARGMACDPVIVAEVIERVLAEPDTIHALSGPDAAILCDAWTRLGEAERLAYGEKQSDEAWFTRFAADFPLTG